MDEHLKATAAEERELPEPDADAGEEEDASPGERELHFLDHLDELRARLIKSAIALVIVTIACAFFADVLVNDILIAPLKRSSETIVLQNLVPYGQISLYLQVVVFSGFILSFPFLVYQIWQFVLPGLKDNEKSATRFVISFISLSFFAGIAFGYSGLHQLFRRRSPDGRTGFRTAVSLLRAVQDGPAHARLHALLPKTRHRDAADRRGLVTPSTDLVTQLVIAVPMILLYEISIWISGYVNRKNEALQ